MNTSEIIGLAASIVVLAGISVAIVNGGNTAKVIGAIGNAFVESIRAATLQGKK
jgi:hypothetical protein